MERAQLDSMSTIARTQVPRALVYRHAHATFPQLPTACASAIESRAIAPANSAIAALHPHQASGPPSTCYPTMYEDVDCSKMCII